MESLVSWGLSDSYMEFQLVHCIRLETKYTSLLFFLFSFNLLMRFECMTCESKQQQKQISSAWLQTNMACKSLYATSPLVKHPFKSLRSMVVELEACTDQSREQVVLSTSRTFIKWVKLCFWVYFPLCTNGTYE